MTLLYKDAYGQPQPLKSTNTTGEHVVHHHVDSLPALAQLPEELGQKDKNASLSVVFASDHGPVPVSLSEVAITSLPALSPGTSRIGDVGVVALPDVVVSTLPAIAQLPQAIGPRSVAGSLSMTLATGHPALPVALDALPAIAQLPTTIGQKAKAASLSVVLANDQDAVPITNAALATIAGDTTFLRSYNPALPAGNNNIGDVDVLTLPAIAQLPSVLGQAPMAASLSVAIASNQSALPISASALPLPASAAQEHVAAASPHAARLSDGTAFYDAVKTAQFPATLGQKTKATSLGVAIASDQDTLNVAVASLPLPSGAAQEHATAVSPHAARLSDGAAFYVAPAAGQLPAALGQGAMATSLSVTIASNQSTLPTSLASLPSIAQLPTSLGQKAKTASLGVVLASDQDALAVTLPATPTANLATIASDTTFLRSYNPSLPAGTNNIGDVDIVSLPALPSSGFSFQTPVGTTEVTLASNAVTVGAILKADDDNVDSIYFRYQTGTNTTNGFRLKPGQPTPCPVNNTNLIRCISGTAAQKVHCHGS